MTRRLFNRFADHARLVDLIFLAALILYVLAGTPLVPFHGDESTLIYTSRDYGYQFMQRDLDLVRFQDDTPFPELQYLRLINGSVIRYAMGLGWHLAGYRVEDVNDQWDWNADWNYNVTTNHAPGEGLLLASRWPSAAFLAASVAAFFVLARQVGGRPVAYLATAYYALNPAILLNGRRAVAESSLLLFGLLAVLAGLWFLRRPALLSALALGAAAGLAVSSKHTNLFVVVPVFAACLLYPFAARLTGVPLPAFSPVRAAALLVVTSAVAALVFFALNPVWWGSNPLEHAALILRLRNDLLAGQAATFEGYHGFGDQLAGFFRHALIVHPQYYEQPAWGDWIGDQITRYEASPWRGISIGGSVPGALALLALVTVGAIALFRKRALSLGPRMLVGFWALTLLLATLLLTPVSWQRYYVPVYPVLGLFGAFGVVALARAARRRRILPP